MQKDARKLAKLRRKVETALREESAPAKVISPARIEEASKPAKPAAPPAKKKRALTPAGRAKLSALMKARWAAKRAGAASDVSARRSHSARALCLGRPGLPGQIVSGNPLTGGHSGGRGRRDFPHPDAIAALENGICAK